MIFDACLNGGRRYRGIAASLGLGLLLTLVALCTGTAYAAESSSLSTEPIPMATEDQLPKRVPPLITIGPDEFLGRGNIDEGILLPTGAIWQPALWVYGDIRTSVNFVEPGDKREEIQEIVGRTNLNFNLKLSGTERLFLQIQPINSKGAFTGYTINPENEDFEEQFNLDLTALFFEGDFGEIFPNIDPEDRDALDIGFSVGRQLIFFQEGIMFNDVIDSIGITRDTVIFPGVIDTRFTGLFGWGDLNRDDNAIDRDAKMLGIFTESDTPDSTVNFDFAYTFADKDNGGDGFYYGAAATQRIRGINTSFRINRSEAINQEAAAVSSGTLLFAELSMTPVPTNNVAYLDLFWGIDEYASAARGETAGGPLGRTGLLFASAGLGRYPAALGNRADDSFGGALGYQMFFNHDLTQLVTEFGVIENSKNKSIVEEGVGFGLRFLHSFSGRYIVQTDGFAAYREERKQTLGLRTEFRVQF